MNFSESQVVIIVGHSGSGKTIFAKSMADMLGFGELGFSYAGRVLSSLDRSSEEYGRIEDYIYSCIVNELSRTGNVVIDGLASKSIYKRLLEEGYNSVIIYLNTPKEDRVARIAEREGCSIRGAEIIEALKAKGKSTAGLEYVIGRAEVVIDGRLSKQNALHEAIKLCQQLGIGHDYIRTVGAPLGPPKT